MAAIQKKNTAIRSENTANSAFLPFFGVSNGRCGSVRGHFFEGSEVCSVSEGHVHNPGKSLM